VATPEGPFIGAGHVPPHRAFFEALGVLPEGSVDWRAALAGLVTLRYLDAWANAGATTADLVSERRAVENAIALLPATLPERMFLAGLVEATASDAASDMTRIVSLRLAYGRALQQRSAWAMAADVLVGAYRACTQATHQPLHRELAASAVLRAGACYRELGEPGTAERAYHVALALGHDAGDEYIVLRARTAIARLAVDRGGPIGVEGERPIVGRIEGDLAGDEPSAPGADATPAAASGDINLPDASQSPGHRR
jgi:hypothetical protein